MRADLLDRLLVTLAVRLRAFSVCRIQRGWQLEFSPFEAITVNEVLKDLGTKSTLDTNATALVAKIKGTEKGAGFDRAYIAFQLDNHEYLRDLADAYLHNSAGTTEPMEKQGRLLASLMLAVFKEHVAICKRVNAELKA